MLAAWREDAVFWALPSPYPRARAQLAVIIAAHPPSYNDGPGFADEGLLG